MKRKLKKMRTAENMAKVAKMKKAYEKLGARFVQNVGQLEM